tara:strand:- start:368 stop:631 length:264 start_codon:yes stop_codon:yes gene_type:complete
MKNYTARTIISGYKLKSSLKGMTLVGVPYLANRQTSIKVTYKGVNMVIDYNSTLFHKELFKDKWNPTRLYTLYYYEWLPNYNQKTFF